MKGWQRQREERRAAAAARAAGGVIVGQPKVIAKMLVALMEDGTARVAMPGDIDAQFALIGRALVVAISQALQSNAPQEETTPPLEGQPALEAGEVTK